MTVGRRLLRASAVLYAGGMAGLYVLERTPLVDWWLFQLIGVFDAWLYLPAPLVVLAVSLEQNWRAGAWAMVPVLAFVGGYGLYFLPHTGREPGIPLRVMTANLEFANEDFVSVGDTLLRQHPDVVAIQELGTAMSGPLADRVRDEYPYQALYPSQSPTGMGILSRLPIRAAIPPEMADDECSCQQVAVELEGRLLTILNVHPAPPAATFARWGPILAPAGFSTGRQERTLAAIRNRAGTATEPLLILGDLNATERERSYRILGQRYHDAYREAGWGFGFTFPARDAQRRPFFPLVRIDYVLHDDAWAVQDAWIESLPGSDHRAVVADLTLQGD